MQSYIRTVLGHYFCSFIVHMSKGFTYGYTLYLLDDGSCTHANDARVLQYITRRYKNSIRGLRDIKLVDRSLIISPLI